MLYERSESFRDWCMDRYEREPVWVKLFDCERCIMRVGEDTFPFFTELEGVIEDRCYRYNTLFAERSFLTSDDKRIELLEWVVENTSGRFTLIEHSGWEGVLFDTAADWVITKLHMSEYHAEVVRTTDGRAMYSVKHPPHWRHS